MRMQAVIAREVPHDRRRWIGVRVALDGNPLVTGKWLWTHTKIHFGGSQGAAAEHFIDHHPGGWRFLDEAFGRNECLCHDHADRESCLVDQSSAPETAWTYVLRTEVLEVRRWDWGVAGRAPWRSDRVHWDQIEQKAAKLGLSRAG